MDHEDLLCTVFPAKENSRMRKKIIRIAIKKQNYFSQFLTLQVICFTRKIKSEVAEEHHLVAISDYCVMLTQ